MPWRMQVPQLLGRVAVVGAGRRRRRSSTEKALNMMASSTTPAIGPWRRPARMAPGSRPPRRAPPRTGTTSGAKARAASVGCSVSSCWANSAMRRRAARRLPTGAFGAGPAEPVVLDHEAVQPLERVVLLGDLLAAGARPSCGPTPRTGRAAARACRRSTGRSCAATGPSARRPPGR